MMLNQMEQTPGAMFHSPHPNKHCKHIGEAFVDNTSLWLLQLGMLLAATIQLMTSTAQCWERLLYSTGGSLQLSKCFCYRISWHFTSTGKPTMVHSTDDGPPIQLISGSSLADPQMIQHLPTNQGQCTLGICLSPNSNDTHEFQYRLQQATQMKQKIAAVPLGCEHIGVSFQSIWQMMIQYPLGTTCFTIKQCSKLQARYLPTFLSKIGHQPENFNCSPPWPTHPRWHGHLFPQNRTRSTTNANGYLSPPEI
jgi:hypothetical protein